MIILQCVICSFYWIRCFRGPIQLPSGGILRGLEPQRHDGECLPKEQRSKLYTTRQLGRGVQQVSPLFHYWGNPGSPSKSWSQRTGCGGGPFQRLLQVGLQQEWDQLSLLRVLTLVDIQYVIFISGYRDSHSLTNIHTAPRPHLSWVSCHFIHSFFQLTHYVTLLFYLFNIYEVYGKGCVCSKCSYIFCVKNVTLCNEQP